jgi:hypothetical protein
MTTEQLNLFNCFYLVELVAVIYFTRATALRVAGALAGGAIFGLVGAGVIALAEAMQWWHVPVSWKPYWLSLMYLDAVISCAPVYLVTWRVVRRFGWRGLAVVLAAVAVIGPVRDYRVAATFPDWMVIEPGVAPALAISTTYVLMVALGHGVMRLIAGPARADRLARSA